MNNPYANPQYDCIKHINTLFPNEQSLINIDSEINKLQAELSTLQGELQEDIHHHAIMQESMWAEVQQVDQLARGVVSEIQDIKQKAEKSEELVYQMCKDIKSLDIAKRNLTFSIKALRQYTMMLNAIDNLRSACVSKKYKQIAMLLSAFDELGAQFKKFENIPQITEVVGERDQIIKELKLQIIDEFLIYMRGNSLQTAADLADACAVVETLGLKYKNELVQCICKAVIVPYQELFSQPENRNLENTERRYAWLVRNLKDFDAKFTSVFPEYWAVHCCLYGIFNRFILKVEFSSITRIQVADILERNQDKEDVAVLMKALQQTLKFEQRICDEVKKRYEVWVNFVKSLGVEGPKLTVQIPEQSHKFVVDSIPKFKGVISNCFEPYLRPYVDNEERELKESISKSLGNDELDASSDLKVFNSSFYMFNYFKQLLKRASQYSRSQVMFDIYKLIRRTLKYYSDELNGKVLREFKQMNNEQNFHTLVCFSINTAEYCKETLPGLEQSMSSYLDSPFSDQVDFSNEEDSFNQMMNKAVETLLQYVDAKVEPIFQKMIKINWELFDSMGDASDYVKETKAVLEPHIQNLKDILSETYLIFYLNKLVVYVNNKFISNVFKMRKISEMGLNQLILDIYELRMSLIAISKLKSDSKSQTSYTNFVNKSIARSETILKLIQMSQEKFLENFADYVKKYPADTVQQDLDRIMLIKGMKKQDHPSLFKLFQK